MQLTNVETIHYEEYSQFFINNNTNCYINEYSLIDYNFHNEINEYLKKIIYIDEESLLIMINTTNVIESEVAYEFNIYL